MGEVRAEFDTGEVVFNDVDHTAYRLVDGRHVDYTRMTSALTAVGAIDTTHFTPESRARGIKIHEAVLLDYLGGLVEGWLPETLLPYWRGYRAFQSEHPFEYELVEGAVWDDALRYAGRYDIFGHFLHGPSRAAWDLLDVKTGSVPRYTGIQTMGYKRRIVVPGEGLPATRVRRWALELPGNDRFRLVPLNMMPGGFHIDAQIDRYHEQLALGAVAWAQWKVDPK
jgi:hypothetical protein